jgi:hypothetical protein
MRDDSIARRRIEQKAGHVGTRIVAGGISGRRHDDRILRFLHLCNRRGSGFPNAFLSQTRSCERNLAIARDVCARVLCEADRLGLVRSFRRPDRPQGDASHCSAHHGNFDGADRPSPDVRFYWRAGARTFGVLPVRPGARTRWRMGGAVLLATENAPAGKLAWYGSFPQLGAPVGFLCSTGIFLLISTHLTNAELMTWG